MINQGKHPHLSQIEELREEFPLIGPTEMFALEHHVHIRMEKIRERWLRGQFALIIMGVITGARLGISPIFLAMLSIGICFIGSRSHLYKARNDFFWQIRAEGYDVIIEYTKKYLKEARNRKAQRSKTLMLCLKYEKGVPKEIAGYVGRMSFEC